jgi:hypothetical protein
MAFRNEHQTGDDVFSNPAGTAMSLQLAIMDGKKRSKKARSTSRPGLSQIAGKNVYFALAAGAGVATVGAVVGAGPFATAGAVAGPVVAILGGAGGPFTAYITMFAISGAAT